MGTEKKTIDIHYTKSPTYRTYHLDGVFGGLTPKGIFIDIFTEQISPPSKIVHEIKEDGNIGDEIVRTNEKVGLLREFQCGIVIDINKAVSIKNWLENKINEFQIGVQK
ncbi:hypothetical protein KJ656_06140 [bacterium]|nr:hypothetical protein [bacterium]